MHDSDFAEVVVIFPKGTWDNDVTTHFRLTQNLLPHPFTKNYLKKVSFDKEFFGCILESVYCKMQNYGLDDNELPFILGCRSMMMGDYVKIDDRLFQAYKDGWFEVLDGQNGTVKKLICKL